VILCVDTSALVRRYDTTEPGADRVSTLLDTRSNNVIYIAELTPVEMASALNRKLREGRLNLSQRDRHWRGFRLHCREQYRVIALDPVIESLAEQLVFAHPLRAYDAIQLASALRARQSLPGGAPDFGFITGDRTQARAAAAEGLAVELIGSNL
jgi:predicted nucleic acid-binding protein